jgi:hypothetical protein
VVGEDGPEPTGIFKVINNLKNYTDERFDTELEKAYQELAELKIELENTIDTKASALAASFREEKEQLINNIENVLTNLSTLIQTNASEIQVIKQDNLSMNAKVNLIDTEFKQVKIDFDRLETNVLSYWQKPASLIFNTRAEADNYIATNKTNVFPGQLITINNEGILETFLIDSLYGLQIISAGGSGGGSPDKITDTQYCIQVFGDIIPDCLNHFTQDLANYITIIDIPNPNRKNNMVTIPALDLPGGYIYYASKLDGLKFTSGGFDAGVTKLAYQIADMPDYFIYRTNQKLIDSVNITIN